MGALSGFKIVEIAGIGPGQFCGMLLADMGAQVIRIERISDAYGDAGIPTQYNLMNRSRPAITLDLKKKEGVELVLRLCADADAIFEGFRPGVMERLGLGPDACMAANKRLVYGRMTGWGQSGPLSATAGHDGNYSALAGVLSTIGAKNGPPSIPLNLVADFGGGGVFLALGMLAALLEASGSGEGQVVDAAMVDGAASLMTLVYGLFAAGMWRDERESNILDGGAPFYRTYRTRDNKYLIVCAIEQQFYQALLEILEIDDIGLRDQFDKSKWPMHIARLETIFAGKSRQEWCDIFADTDACIAPVLSLAEAPAHPHMKSRATFVSVDGVLQPAPAPRFSRTPSKIKMPPEEPGMRMMEVLGDWGLTDEEITELRASAALGP
jgi:alpha-methylacyl-CoA racemase